ncbi:hypothetical protein [Caulobacter sp. S45]|uniref:hypothetical protein n=1 Tax=Caulobacter sp. S45 TaxID=1641861 RepID=UPI00131A766A|nr:hypothetical protein [Caulobacter sp. S45]
MTIFAILMPSPQDALSKKIEDEFKTDSLKITDTQYLVSAQGTAQEICVRLGIFNSDAAVPVVGQGIVFATSGYFGRAPANIWEWVKAKLEAPTSATTS